MTKKFTFLVLLAFAMLSLQTAEAQHRAATITGYALLEGQTQHSGIKVLFTAVSPSAVTDSVFTAFDGAFTAGLAEGIYTVEYSKQGYVIQTLPGTFDFFGNDSLPEVTLLPGFSGTIEVSGAQSGVWESGYLVKVMDEISVAADDTLWIQPGVTVRFMGYYKLEVFGTLLAVGAEGDSILFTSGQPNTAPGDWQAIHFQNATSSGSVVSYAIIQYGQRGIYCQNYASLIISHNFIRWNSENGIRCSSSSPTIQQNQISYNNYEGIFCYSSSPTIQQNQISYNNYDGISCDSSSPTIQQNQINNNYDGIYCSYSSSPTIQQNQIS
jgi:parallel beta-helix repeat protein